MPANQKGTGFRWRIGRALRLARGARLDLADTLAGRRDPMVAPRWRGLPSQYPHLGEMVVNRMLVGGAGLEATDRVLDIGCGTGRVAVALTRKLGESGSYEGIDIMSRSISWAQRKITPRHPNFRFQVSDVRNAMYNPGGAIEAVDYRFPFADDEFDIALATSLFTHLMPVETQRYLAEVARVLRPGGRFVSSYMLLNEESERLIADGIPDRAAVAPLTGLRLDSELTDSAGNTYRTPHPDMPEQYVAVSESDVREWHEQVGLRIERIVLGGWCGRDRSPEALGQDFVIARLPD